MLAGGAFEEGTVTLETQPFVDTDGTRVVLPDVEDDVAQVALQQLGYDGAGHRRAVAPPPVGRVGEDVAHSRHAVGGADQVGACGRYQLAIGEDAVEGAFLHLRRAKGDASAEGVQLCQLAGVGAREPHTIALHGPEARGRQVR